jgi:hypothetical protein
MRMAMPTMPKPDEPLPVMHRSEAEEEAWWARVFRRRGMLDPVPVATKRSNTQQRVAMATKGTKMYQGNDRR